MPRLDDLLTGFAGGGLETYIARQEAKRKAAEEFETKRRLLEAEAELKFKFDPVAQAQSRYLNLARREAEFPESVNDAAQEREMNILRHFFPRAALGQTAVLLNPLTGEVSPIEGGKSFAPGTKIITQPLSAEDFAERERQRLGAKSSTEALGATEAISAAQARGKQAGAPSVERTMAKQSARTALASIKEIRSLLDPDFGGDPSLLLSGGLPGIQGSRRLAKAMANIKLEIVTARGGKQLTPSEQRLVKATFPNTIDALDALLRQDPSVIQDTLDRMELVSDGLLQGLEPESIQQQLRTLEGSGETRTDEQESAYQRLRARYAR